MFNPIYKQPLEMFSWQHIVALVVVVSIILIVFFCRKFFMKYHVADVIFRYTLAFLLLFFELVPHFHDGPRLLFGHILTDTYPLCGFMLWICAIALLSNSKRIIKVVYPVAITGALMSLIIVDSNYTFPHFKAFQFFFTHGTFLLGVLYYVFTKKISRYTIKDLGYSCLFLFGFSCYELIITSGKLVFNKEFTDPLFLIAPPGGLEFFKDALGQVGYTIIYMILVLGVLFAIYGVTYACTRKRSYEDEVQKPIKSNKVFNYLKKFSNNQKYLFIGMITGAGIYISTLQKVTGSYVLLGFDILIFIVLFVSLVLNEILYYYNLQTEKDVCVSYNTVAEQDKNIEDSIIKKTSDCANEDQQKE